MVLGEGSARRQPEVRFDSEGPARGRSAWVRRPVGRWQGGAGGAPAEAQTRTRAHSSRARRSPARSPTTALRSAWTAKQLGGTTCSSTVSRFSSVFIFRSGQLKVASGVRAHPALGVGLAASPSHTTVLTGPYTAVRQIMRTPVPAGGAAAGVWNCASARKLRSLRRRAVGLHLSGWRTGRKIPVFCRMAPSRCTYLLSASTVQAFGG
jgi:hypothetical protein